MAGSYWTSIVGGGGATAPVPAVSGLDESAGASTLLLKANTQHAQKTWDGTTALYDIDSRSTVAAITHNFGGVPPTITAASGTTYSQVGIGAVTVTLTGATGVTALDGLGLYVGVPTVTDATGCTVTTLSNLYVALPVAGGSVTGTNIFTCHFAGAVKIDGNVNLAAGAATLIAAANTAAALSHSDGTTGLYVIDTRNTVTVQNHLFANPASQTLPSGATSRFRMVTLAAPTVTLAGTTQITTTNQGATLFVGGPTYNQSGGAVTVDQVSCMHIGQVTAGASVTITTKYMVSTDVSDCFLTNAGVWTDHASGRAGKQAITGAEPAAVDAILAQIRPRTWQYREEVHGDDAGRQRVGIVTDELPDALATPGPYGKRGIAAGVIGSFALAALKTMHDRNKELEARVARLEQLLSKQDAASTN